MTDMKRISAALLVGACMVAVSLTGEARFQNYGYTIGGWGIGDTISEAHAKADWNASERCNIQQCEANSVTGGSYVGASKTVAPGKGNTGDSPCGWMYDVEGGILIKEYGCDNEYAETTSDGRWIYFVSGICTCYAGEEEYNQPASVRGRIELTATQKVQKAIKNFFDGLFRKRGR